MELPSLELNCLKDFVPDSELKLLLSELELNCKNGIDPGSGTSMLWLARTYAVFWPLENFEFTTVSGVIDGNGGFT